MAALLNQLGGAISANALLTRRCGGRFAAMWRSPSESFRERSG